MTDETMLTSLDTRHAFLLCDCLEVIFCQTRHFWVIKYCVTGRRERVQCVCVCVCAKCVCGCSVCVCVCVECVCVCICLCVSVCVCVCVCAVCLCVCMHACMQVIMCVPSFSLPLKARPVATNMGWYFIDQMRGNRNQKRGPWWH